MKRHFKFAGVVVLVLASLTACKAAFFFSGNSLKNAVLKYYLNLAYLPYGPPASFANGHDFTTFTFDATGRAGSLEVAGFTFGFATQAAVTSGKYTDKSWFQDGGSRGTFTYDPDTYVLTVTLTEYYAPSPGAALMSNGQNAAADYSYLALSIVQGVDSASSSGTFTIILTQDAPYSAYIAGSAAGPWVYTTTSTDSKTAFGVTTTDDTTQTTTITIGSDSVTLETLQHQTHTEDSTVTKYTSRSTTEYAIQNFFLVGQEDTSGVAFAEAWKKGNTVTFQLLQTRQTSVQYPGDTEPPAPTVDPTSGSGWTFSDAGSYSIDETGGHTYVLTLTNNDAFITFSLEAEVAARTLSR